MTKTLNTLTAGLLLAGLIASAGPASAAPTIVGDGHVEIYFTTPGVSPETAGDPEVDDALMALIDSATTHIDIASYDFGYAGIIDAVVDAHDRGVAVRFIGDVDEADQAGYIALSNAGVPMSLRMTSGIMHDKIIIVDGRWVATGSMNHSDAGVLRNNNHLLIIDDAVLAADYTAELDQMVAGDFGRQKVTLASAGERVFGDTAVEVHFSPQSAAPVQALRDAVAGATHGAYFMVFSFTRNDVAEDLIAKHHDGVEVVGIYDVLGASNHYATDEMLALVDVPVLRDGNSNTVGSSGGKLHHKVLIVDPGTPSGVVVAGSFNWTNAAADNNDENLIVLTGAAVSAAFMGEFCEVFDAAIPHPDFTGTMPDPCATPVLPTPQLRINELLANPNGTDTPEEYVEIVNAGNSDVDLTGFTLGDIANPARHIFAPQILAVGDAVVVYGGANAAEPNRLTASSGLLSLNNSSETVTLADADGAVIDSVSYSGAVSGQAINRLDDGGLVGDFDLHSAIAPDGVAGSPGLRVDGAEWLSTAEAIVGISALEPNPTGTDLGQEWVEIVNTGLGTADLSGWTLGDASSPARHVFADGATLAPGAALVIYDRGTHAGAIVSSTGTLSLNNGGDTITLYGADSAVIDSVTYESSVEGEALTWGDVTDPGDDGEPSDPEPTLVPGAVTASESGSVATGAWVHLGPYDALEGTVTVTMTGSGDPDLYVRVDGAPTDSVYDCRPYFSGADESCTVSGPGMVYVSVQGYTAGDFAITVDYTGLVPDDGGATTAQADVVISALLADPAGTDLGQEYVVIANLGDAAADLSDMTLSDASSVRHTFSQGTTLAAGATLVLFDRGDHSDVPDAILASTTRLSLNNGGDTVTLAGSDGALVDTISYGAATSGQQQDRGVDF